MARFVAEHLLFLLLTLLVVSFLVFTLNEFSPGAVARKVLGAYATQEQVDLLTTQMGLDRPLLVRYVAVIVRFDAGYVVSMIRASMVEVMQRPYIRTAVLKGLSFRRVILKHALRNAMLTPITVIMLQLNYLVAGVVVVETVFAYPGFGRMMLEAALFKDIALIEAGALVAVFVAVATNILGDLAYMVLDPRIRA